MKSAIIILSVIATAIAQRPWYLGSGPVGSPQLSPRFQTEDNSSPPKAPNPNDYYNIPANGIPIDARGDVDLVNRLRGWPRENQPFWLINADQIEAHRNTHRNSGPNRNYYYSHYPYANNYRDYVAVVDLPDKIVLLGEEQNNDKLSYNKL